MNTYPFISFTDYTSVLNALNSFALKAFYASNYFSKDSNEFYQFTFNQCEQSSQLLIVKLKEFLQVNDQELLADIEDRIRLRSAHFEVAQDTFNEDLSVEYNEYSAGDDFQDKYDMYYNEY